jgi:hypothetical protein
LEAGLDRRRGTLPGKSKGACGRLFAVPKIPPSPAALMYIEVPVQGTFLTNTRCRVHAYGGVQVWAALLRGAYLGFDKPAFGLASISPSGVRATACALAFYPYPRMMVYAHHGEIDTHF